MTSISLTDNQTYLSGHLLLAMPSIGDPRFERAAIYVCAHDSKGAMGIVVNKVLKNASFEDLMKSVEQVSDLKLSTPIKNIPILEGGPVEKERGFLIHSSDVAYKETIKVQNDIYVTATIDALIGLGKDKRPENLIFALGYAGWQAGQLEHEVQANAWLTVRATPELVFQKDHDEIWEKSLNGMGINAGQLSSMGGSA